MYPYAINVTGIIVSLRPHLLECFAKITEYSAGDAGSVLDRLLNLSQEIEQAPHKHELEPELSKYLDTGGASTIRDGVASFLLSQLYFEREMPRLALKYNDRARLSMNGILAPFGPAAISSQRIGIFTQHSRLDLAMALRNEVRKIDVAPDDMRLIAAPLTQLEISLAFEAGRAPETLEEELLKFRGDAYAYYWLGRLHINSGRYNAALAELDKAAGSLSSDDPHDEVLLSIIELERARALYLLGSLNRADAAFARLEEFFTGRMLSNARLAARIGLADVLRVRHSYDSSKALLGAVFSDATELGLLKTAYRAALRLAIVALDEGHTEPTDEWLTTAEKYLNEEFNRKEFCTLYTRRSEFAYKQDNPRLGKRYLKKALKLLTDTGAGADEVALMHANSSLVEVWYSIRRNDLTVACKKLDRAINDLQQTVFSSQDSVYRSEASAQYLVAKLWRTKAYCLIRASEPDKALQCTERAGAYLSKDTDPDQRSRARIIFLDSLAHALASDADRSITCLETVSALSPELGLSSPIRNYLAEYEELDSSDVVSELAFSVYSFLQQSHVYERFRLYEPDFASVIRPSLGLPFLTAPKALPGRDKLLRSFVREYETELAAELAPLGERRTNDSTVLDDFRADVEAQLEQELRSVPTVSSTAIQYPERDEEELRQLREIWDIIAAVRRGGDLTESPPSMG